MCLRGCFCCGPSLSGVVNVIAIIDLITSLIPVTFETVTIGTLSGILRPLPELKTNCSNNCTWLYEYIGDDIHFYFDTYSVTILIICILLGFIVEAYLFSTLRRGVNEKIYKECRKWWNYRIFLLLLVTCGSILKFLRGQYFVPIDGFLDVLKLYRIVTILIVRCYMTELAHTVGIIYVKPPKRPKRGSL